MFFFNIKYNIIYYNMSDQYLPTYIDNVDNSISIMNNENAISYYKNNGDINTVSAKNIAHRKIY